MTAPAPSRELRGASVFDDPLVRELLAARLIGVFATLEPDGSVHAVPMWIAPAEGAVLLATGSRSRKVRNLERDARATLVLHDSRPGAEVCGASMWGRTAILRGEEAARSIAAVHRRYVAEAGLRLAPVAGFLSSDDVAIRFVPEGAVTWDQRGSPADEALRAAGAALALKPTAPR